MPTAENELQISVVVPAYNEQDNVVPLIEAVREALDGRAYEIIFVDDGSTDETFERLRSCTDPQLRVIKFRRNFGQTAALDAGFKAARGRVIVPMDADLQNDPADIPKLLEKLDEGFDVVSGWRRDRKDPFSKRVISRGANLLRKVLIHDTIHDSGCTLKAYRSECLKGLDLYGEMHRFIPALLQWRGFRIAELPVTHHERRHGQTKYNVFRVLKGFLDMVIVSFWMNYSARPIHLFGSLGVITTGLGFFCGLYLSIIKLMGTPIAGRPLLLLAVLLIIVGVEFIIFGVMSDILVKIYYRDQPTYNVETELDNSRSDGSCA